MPRHTWEPLPVQPQLRKVPGHVSQNDGDGYRWYPCSPHEMTPPYAPGQRVPVREEWTVCDVGEMVDEACEKDAVVIAYKGDEIVICHDVNNDEYRRMKELLEYLEVCGDGGDNWQPASTLPDWAVRKWDTVLSCIPLQAKNVTEEQARSLDCYDESSGLTAQDCFLSFAAGKWPEVNVAVDEVWGWLTTWEE